MRSTPAGPRSNPLYQHWLRGPELRGERGHEMLQTTIDAVRAILTADPSVNADERRVLVETLRNGPRAEARHDRVLRRPEAARRLGVGVKALDVWKRRGVLVPVIIPGSSRALGYRESDVEALIACGREEAMA